MTSDQRENLEALAAERDFRETMEGDSIRAALAEIDRLREMAGRRGARLNTFARMTRPMGLKR